MRVRYWIAAAAVLAAGPAAAQWGPYNAEFPAAADSIVRKTAAGVPDEFTLAGWVKPAAVAAGQVPIAGMGGAFLCTDGGSAAFCFEGTVVRSATMLPAGRWTHVAASYDGRNVTLFVDGRQVAQQAAALKPGKAPVITLGPRNGQDPAFAGRIAGFTVTPGVRAAFALPQPPNEALINFETGSPHWPLQVKQMLGQVTPQDPATLPRAVTPVSEPAAIPAYAGPALVATGPGTWLVKAWSLQAAPDVAETGDRLSAPSYEMRDWYRATVPGTVLTTLVDRGVYPDPAFGLNNLAIPESLNKQDYWYRATFATPDGYRPGRHLFVTFKGVNYAGEVWLNGRRLGGMRGAFIRGTFDIAPYVRARGGNALAIRVSPPPHPGIPHEESLAAGVGENGGVLAQDGPTFIASEGWDWIPSVRDRNTGLWQDVALRSTGDVVLGDPHVITMLPKPDNSVANIDIDVPLTNLGKRAVATTVRVTIDGAGKPVVVSKRVTLAPGQGTVRFKAAEFAALRIAQPKLWWPNGYGAPNLHRLTLQALQGRAVSDESSSRFGIRSVTYELSLVDTGGNLHRVEADFARGRELGVRITDGRHEAIRKVAGGWATGLRQEAVGSAAIRELPPTTLAPHLVIKVNGVRIAARGGNWGMDDWRKRVDRSRLEPYFRLHRDANVNIIRNWVGQNTEDVFFELADEYGLMVLNDFWASTQDYNVEPQDVALFMDNARDVVQRYRHHPSIVMWFGRNEGVPQPVLNEALEALVHELDGTRWYTGSSNRVNLQNSGPYAYKDPATYFTEHAKGFSVEVGTPSFPTLEAMAATVGGADQWPLGDAVAYHDWHPDGNGAVKPFMDAVATAYGPGVSLPDFERKAQMLNYDSHRAIFEGMNAGLWTENSGRMLWMTQPAWPSTMWQILSHDYDTHAAFYGVKSASEPVHVQMNLPDYRLLVVNNPATPLRGAAVRMQAYAADGALVGLNDAQVDVDAAGISAPLDMGLATLLREHGLLVVRLVLTDAQGAVLSHNVYWPSSTPAGQQALNTLAQVPLTVSAQRTQAGGEQLVSVELRNDGKVPALATKLTLVDSAGARILPAYWSDNYVALMPGERRVVTVRYAGDVGTAVGLQVRGWNSAQRSVEVK